MKKRFDILLALLLVLFLVAAVFINSILIRGVMLLIFALILIANTVWSLLLSVKGEAKDVVIYSILLFFEAALAIGSILVIVNTVLGV